MQRDYYNLVLNETFTNQKIYLIERYKSNNKIHGFYLGSGSKYYCFMYENGFDEFVSDGDKLSKKTGELKLKITKPNKEEKTFTFEIKECDKSFNEIASDIYVEEHSH